MSSLEQATTPKDTGGQSVAGQQVDPKQAKLMERVRAALPSVIEASAAMDHAHDALRDKALGKAIDDERTALFALMKAIEEFSDLKQMTELAWGEQEGIVEKLGQPDQAREVGEGVRRNVGRVERLKALIADELAQLAQAPPPKDPKQADAQKQQLEQEKQKLGYAEVLRGQAAEALGKLDKALGDAKSDATVPAKEADAKLLELRKLFFSVIEHLQQLIRDQGETHDQTSAASAEDDFARAPKLPGLLSREDEHGKLAKAITDALAAQADAAGKQPQPQPGAPSAKALAGAADEVRAATGDMLDATGTLTKAKEGKQSMTLDPATKSEEKAIEHLTNALKLLQPPPQQKQDDQKQDQKQDQKPEPKKDQQQQQQQGGAGQRARDEDAKRQKERQQKAQPQSDAMDQDW